VVLASRRFDRSIRYHLSEAAPTLRSLSLSLALARFDRLDFSMWSDVVRRRQSTPISSADGSAGSGYTGNIRENGQHSWRGSKTHHGRDRRCSSAVM
jgi:hypothetical protein